MNLLNLLGIQSGPNPLVTPTSVDPSILINNAVEPQPQADITVTGAPAPVPQPAPQLDVPQVPLDALRAKPEDLQRMQPLEGLPQHKGMFGVKGTLRDVLGLIGDTFLVGSGGKAVYAPQRQKERMSDALVGMGPGKEKDAIARMMALDYETGIKMYNDWQARLAAANKAELEEKRLQRQETNDVQKRRLSKLRYAAGMSSIASADPRLKAGLRAWLEDDNATLEDLPDELLPGATYTPSQQVTNRERAEHNDATERVAQQNADSNRIRANRPPAGRAAPQPTDASMAAPLIQKMGRVGWDGMTKNEQQQLRSLGRSPDRGNKKNRFGGSPPPKKGGSPAPAKGGWGSMTVR